MSNGKYFFAYHALGRYNGLHYIRRGAPFGLIKMIDKDYEIDLVNLA